MSDTKKHDSGASEGARRSTENAPESSGEHWRGRWSAKRKVSVVLELLRGADLKRRFSSSSIICGPGHQNRQGAGKDPFAIPARWSANPTNDRSATGHQSSKMKLGSPTWQARSPKRRSPVIRLAPVMPRSESPRHSACRPRRRRFAFATRYHSRPQRVGSR